MLVRIVGGHGGVAPGYRATSYLIDGKILLDAGSVASGMIIDQQLLIDYILISHAHMDHICELAFLSDNCFGLKGRPFEVYCSKVVRKAVTGNIMNDIIWPDFTKLPNKDNPTIRFNDIDSEKVLELGDYRILPVRVHHPGDALGFIVEHRTTAVLFTQDTGPTERIWELGKQYPNLKAIFTEVSFPNHLSKVAKDSQHHTPKTLGEEIKKMPTNVPIFVGHLKPNYQKQLYQEIEELKCERINLLGSDEVTYVF